VRCVKIKSFRNRFRKCRLVRTDQYGGGIENRARFLFEVRDAVLEIWPSQRVEIKTGPIISESGVFRAIESTLPTYDYIFDRLNAYDLSHVLLMAAPVGLGLVADLSATPLAQLKGEAIFQYFSPRYRGNLISIPESISLAAISCWTRALAI